MAKLSGSMHWFRSVLHQLYDALFANGQYVRQWSLASLTAVFKKGDATSLDNYRAIAMKAVYGKLYSVLLDTRMPPTRHATGGREGGLAGRGASGLST